jgi:hypothetical protein
MKDTEIKTDFMTERAVLSDRASGTVVHGDEVVGYTESKRNGRATHASLGAEEVRRGISGRPPQNEEGTLEACRTLVTVLNEAGDTWGPPTAPITEIASVDAICFNGTGGILQLQVVRARVDNAHWKALAKLKRVETIDPVDAVADELRASVRHKEAIGADVRPDIVLIISALDSPEQSFDRVVLRFKARFGQDIAALGFRAIWVVGPNPGMTHRVA